MVKAINMVLGGKEDMIEFLDEQAEQIVIYDEQLVRRLMEKITVYDDRFTVEFKSGTSVDVRR